VVAVQETELKLVEGRSCGNCVVCCYVTDIDTPEFRKPGGVTCANCTGKGCGIYETRPPVCRTYYCGWWYTPELGEDWRPDKSGVIIGTRSDIPVGSELQSGWQFNVFGGEVAIRRVGFVEMISSLVGRAVPVMLSASGPMGTPCEAAIVNTLLADVVKRNDLRGALTVLLSIHRELLDSGHKRQASGSPTPDKSNNGKP